jgi:triosephosphate isomerase (TIM)
MRKKIIAANWKMNLTHREILPYLDALLAKAGRVVLIPAFTALPVLAEALTRVPGVQLGAQNMHWAQSGAFTGEVSPAMLQACSVRYVVLGHSERRVLFGETDEGVNRKVLSALNAGLNPILCVGESLEERESGRVEERLGQQLRRALTDVPPKIVPRIQYND